MQGYDYTHNGLTRHSAPVLFRDDGPPKEEGNLTFEELLTLRLVRAFREDARLGLPTIKAAARIATTEYGVGNPFVTRAFRSDGRTVFLMLGKSGEVHGDQTVLVEALTGQRQFADVVEPSLFRNVVFIDEVVSEWRPCGKDRSVVIRPDRAFGAPHIADRGVRTDVVAEAVAAEGGGEASWPSVACWFGLSETEVRDAVEAEAEWRRAA